MILWPRNNRANLAAKSSLKSLSFLLLFVHDTEARSVSRALVLEDSPGIALLVTRSPEHFNSLRWLLSLNSKAVNAECIEHCSIGRCRRAGGRIALQLSVKILNTELL